MYSLTLRNFCYTYNQLQHLLPFTFIFWLCYPHLTIYPLKMTWNPWQHHRTYQCSTWSRKFEVCLNKTGDYTWSKRSQNEKRKPVPGKGIRLLLFDKCKFTNPLKWKKWWTCQTTHWSQQKYIPCRFCIFLANLSDPFSSIDRYT